MVVGLDIYDGILCQSSVRPFACVHEKQYVAVCNKHVHAANMPYYMRVWRAVCAYDGILCEHGRAARGTNSSTVETVESVKTLAEVRGLIKDGPSGEQLATQNKSKHTKKND